MRATSLIVFDEAPMGNKLMIEKLDEMLRDVRQDERSFGGVVVLMSGDFAQNLPVVKRGGRAQIVAATIKWSRLWNSVTQLALTTNMRTRDAAANPFTATFNAFLAGIGTGTLNEYPRLPDVVHRGDLRSLIAWTFPGISDARGGGESRQPPGDDRGALGTVLASTNRVVQRINDMVCTSPARR